VHVVPSETEVVDEPHKFKMPHSATTVSHAEASVSVFLANLSSVASSAVRLWKGVVPFMKMVAMDEAVAINVRLW
jgi:hypothetical protein